MATTTCIICNGSNSKFCATCHSILHCSPRCQKLDWPPHKTICKTFTNLLSKPSSSHKLAILLPVDSKDAQLIWIECQQQVDEEDGCTFERADIKQYLDVENISPKYGHSRDYKSITRNALRGHNLGYTIQAIVRDTFLFDGSTQNSCVQHITKGQLGQDWRGPILVMRMPGTATNSLLYEDISAGDLRVVVDYFVSYGS